MTDLVDDILSEMDRTDDLLYWNDSRIESLQTVAVFPTYWAYISVALDGIPLALRVAYNEIDAGFFVDILSDDGAIDVKGLRICTNSDMLDGLAILELGRLFAIDLEKGQSDPLYDFFGARFILMYLPRASK